jgi:hypothetical protein
MVRPKTPQIQPGIGVGCDERRVFFLPLVLRFGISVAEFGVAMLHGLRR